MFKTTTAASLLFFAAVGGSQEDPSSHKAKAKYLKQQQVEWLRSRGGFVSEKATLEPPSEKYSAAGGWFAKEEIKKGEKIFFIPRDSVLKPYEEAYPYPSLCDGADRLVDEYSNGEESEFWPYVQYVFESFPHWELPYAWSEAGKTLVHNIVGQNLLEPQEFGIQTPCYLHDVTGEDLYDYDDETKKLLDAALRITIARGWDHVLVPVYDMANHHNGKYHNIDQLYDSATHHDFEVVALRDIEMGEPLCLSYNQCNDSNCTDIDDTYNAPSFFNDYGFVEQFPQIWHFNPDSKLNSFVVQGHSISVPDSDQNGITVEIAEDETKPNSFLVTWMSDKPSPEDVKWLEMNLKRLEGMRDYVLYTAEKLPAHEGDAAIAYYHAITKAIELAIQPTYDSQGECKASSNKTSYCISRAEVLEVTNEGIQNTVGKVVGETADSGTK